MITRESTRLVREPRRFRDGVVPAQEDARLYKDMGDFSSTRKIMDAVLEDYNLNRTPQALVLFEMALSSHESAQDHKTTAR